MAKVIVERPRVGGHGAGKGERKNLAKELAADETPKHAGMKPHPRYRDRKQLNENLNPLYKWLDRQVGRPWSKDFCLTISNR